MKFDFSNSSNDDENVRQTMVGLSRSSIMQSPSTSSTNADTQNGVWLAEMEKGYENLIDIIIPFLGEIDGAERLKKK
jgi:hypothetical protein